MPVRKRRCASCRDYFDAADMITRGIQAFCSQTCVRDTNKQVLSRKVTRTSDKSSEAQRSVKKRVRAEVINRDGDGCLVCRRASPGLHLHRVVYGSQGGKYEVSNCVQLCLWHHQMIHSSKRLWFPILARYLSDREQVGLMRAWKPFREACREAEGLA